MNLLTDEEIVAINDKHYDIAFRSFESDNAIARAIEAAVLERLTNVDVEPDKLDAMTKVIAELEMALDCNEYIERRQYSEPHTMAATVRGHINKAMDLLVIEAAKAGFAKALNPDPASALTALRAENERLIVQLAGCGVAALGNTESSKEQRAKQGDYGYSESYAEVCRAVDREIELRAENERLNAVLKIRTDQCDRVIDQRDTLRAQLKELK